MRITNLGAALNTPVKSFEIGDGVRLSAKEGFDASPRHFYLFGERFDSESTAHEVASQYADALRFAGIVLRWPLRIAQDIGASHVAAHLSRGEGWRGISGAKGLIVYEEEPDVTTKFYSVSGTGYTLCGRGRFVLAIESGLESVLKRGPLLVRERLACDFLAASVEIESHIAPSFVMRVSAVEVLVSQRTRSAQFQECLERIKKSDIYGQLEGVERQDIGGALDRLKREGVMAGIRRICLPIMGKEWMKEFTYLYGIRSKIVHAGQTPKREEHERLKVLVEDLFMRMIDGPVSDL